MVPVEDCDCPQPEFVDCSKGPVKRDPGHIYDPVVFENRAGEPVDVFFYNGTCEELVSWDDVGGVQPWRKKPLLSTQGHAFRLRAAASRRFLMAHTLNDLVIRSCDDEAAKARGGASLDGLESLRAQTRFFEGEAMRLREQLATELSKLQFALRLGSNSTSTLPADYVPATAAAVAAVAPMGATTWALLTPAK